MDKSRAFFLLFLLFFTGVVYIFFETSRSIPPDTFVKTDNPEQIDLALSDQYTYDELWSIVNGILNKNFALKHVSKKQGLIETEWEYPSVGKFAHDEKTQVYKTQLIFQFSPNRYSLFITPKAEFRERVLLAIDLWWIKGMDTSAADGIVGIIKDKIGKIP